VGSQHREQDSEAFQLQPGFSYFKEFPAKINQQDA
jgi:hypothetical protein